MLINSKPLLDALDLSSRSRSSFDDVSKATGLSVETIRWMNKSLKLPDRQSIGKLAGAFGISETELSLDLGYIDDRRLRELRGEKANGSGNNSSHRPEVNSFATELGALSQEDCLSFMNTISSESVDTVFADPPFNLNKEYPSKMNDALKDEAYLEWCISWLDECCRILKFGGSMFIYNLPKWNLRYSEYLSRRLTFRHSVAIKMAYSLPISGRLYPAHYSMLYFCKGAKPNTFKPDRLPMETCPKCYGDLVDYGGYKSKMNSKGVNIMDVWTDIPPVRHSKYKKRKGANELSIKLLDRVIEMSTKEGDVVFDPFGGSGTTYAVAEMKKRKWLGCEIGPIEQIQDRLMNLGDEELQLKEIRNNLNSLHTPKIKSKRKKLGIWTSDTFLSND